MPPVRMVPSMTISTPSSELAQPAPTTVPQLLQCSIDHAALVAKDRAAEHMLAVADPTRHPGPPVTVFTVLYCSTRDDCRLLREEKLCQLLLAQNGWNESRVRELLKRLIRETDIPDGTRPAELTIHDVTDRRRDGARLIHLVHLLEAALAPRAMAGAIERGYAMPLRTTNRQ